MECKICGEDNCKKHSILLSKVKKIEEFSGSSPPEIFVGKWNYPNVYTGVLAPTEYGNTEKLSAHEIWHEKKIPINDILKMRAELIYSRTQSNIRKALTDKKFLPQMQEVAMSEKSVGAEYKLERPVTKHEEKESRVPLISRAAPLKKMTITDNVSIKKKVDYIVNDTDVKSAQALVELSNSNVKTSSLIKILSAGLLGIGKNRKLVPTRWSITAVDDTLSKEKLSRIRLYKQIQEISVFHAEYVGNHYEFLLLPDNFEFEVIEKSQTSSSSWHDHESFFARKKYADSVTGAYYANRLALTEYLDKIKKQASCLVIREIRPEYYAPLGVGILRQISREAFTSEGKTFDTTSQALADIQTRIKQPVNNFTSASIILKNYGKQKKISEFF